MSGPASTDESHLTHFLLLDADGQLGSRERSKLLHLVEYGKRGRDPCNGLTFILSNL